MLSLKPKANYREVVLRSQAGLDSETPGLRIPYRDLGNVGRIKAHEIMQCCRANGLLLDLWIALGLLFAKGICRGLSKEWGEDDEDVRTGLGRAGWLLARGPPCLECSRTSVLRSK